MARKLKTDTNTGATAVAPRNTQSAEDCLKPQGDQAQARTSAPAAVTPQGHTGGGPGGALVALPGTNSGAVPTVLTITGPVRGRRRAGRDFGAQPMRIPVNDLTEAEIEALTGDPMLMIEVGLG